MRTRFDRVGLACLSAACTLVLCVPAHSLAAAKKTPAKPAAAKSVVSASPSDAAYEEWLRKHGAYDRLARPAEDGDDQDAGNALKRAEGLLLQGAPQQALALIENQPSYAEPDQEIRRLWLGAGAHRLLGDAYKAVVWYSHAAKLMDAKTIKARLSGEPGLEVLWRDVWRRQYWSYAANPSANREALEQTLRTLLSQADAAWGQDAFWGKAKDALAQASGVAAEEQSGQQPAKQAEKPAAKDAPLSVSEADRLRIAQAVAVAGLEDQARAQEILSGVADPSLRSFWSALVGFLKTGETQDPKGLSAAGYAKAAGFWSANLLAPYSSSREEWLLGSASPTWSKFRQNLMQLSREQAREAVDKELQSQLLSEEMSRLLRSATFVLTLEEGGPDAAREAWGGLDKRKLPLCLRLAGGIAYQEDIKTLLPQEIGAAGKLAPVLGALLTAAGVGQQLPGEAPFWTKAEVGKSSTVGKVWPMDRLLVLADWQARWNAAPSSELARRSAFLFPETAFGYNSLAYLARRAVDERYFQMASAYLQRMADVSVDKKQQAVRLALKAKLEKDSGQDEDALKTYHELVGLGLEMEPEARRDMATFLQLKNDFAEARKQLLILWDQRDKLSRPLQAEVLFWLGEGEHSQRNYDAALDYYLRLAYQYPKESMWATAALYRSAMIYEVLGKYDAARKFLNTVMATAERKEEREAAKNRLSALDAKSGRPSTGAKEGGDPLYPF